MIVRRYVRAAFDAAAAAPGRMRALVRDALDDACGERCYDVELAVSEMVANVVEHTGVGGTLAVTVQADGAVLVEVADVQGSWGPPPAKGHLGGRGLGIVDSVADAWDVSWSPHGKTVWAAFNGFPTTAPVPVG